MVLLLSLFQLIRNLFRITLVDQFPDFCLQGFSQVTIVSPFQLVKQVVEGIFHLLGDTRRCRCHGHQCFWFLCCDCLVVVHRVEQVNGWQEIAMQLPCILIIVFVLHAFSTSSNFLVPTLGRMLNVKTPWERSTILNLKLFGKS